MSGHQQADIPQSPCDPRSVVRLIQCSQCSHILRSPVRIPCGETICQQCLPPSHKRSNITFPVAKEREQGFRCSIRKINEINGEARECGGEHAVADCGLDVVLDGVLEVFENSVNNFLSCKTAGFGALGAGGLNGFTNPDLQQSDCSVMGDTFCHGPLTSAYMLAVKGQLPYRTDTTGGGTDTISAASERIYEPVFDDIRQAVTSGLDCQICLSLIVEPCTTPCGHTFCRSCMTRVLNQANMCPICRRKLVMSLHSVPKNLRLAGLISTFFPTQLADRVKGLREDLPHTYDETKVPLFVCTLSFPTMKTFLYIFEPRYRLMIRRVMESGHPRFGMVMPKRDNTAEGESEPGSFLPYGTMLEIHRHSTLADGRCIIQATGQYKFKVLGSSMLDGYAVGEVERVDDIIIADEELLEVTETSSTPGTDINRGSHLDRLPTRTLFNIGMAYIVKCRAEKAPWLHDRVFKLYGEPLRDPRDFPYWFASVLPRPEEERYVLLPETSVRGRLKIVARWIQKLEQKEWTVGSARNIPLIPAGIFPSGSRRSILSSLIATFQALGGILLLPLAFFLLYALTSGPISIPASSSVSFFILPLGFSFTYTHPPSAPPSSSSSFFSFRPAASDPEPRGFVVPGSNWQYISKSMVLSAIIATCVLRIIRRVVIALDGDRERRQQQRMDHPTPAGDNNVDGVREQNDGVGGGLLGAEEDIVEVPAAETDGERDNFTADYLLIFLGGAIMWVIYQGS